MALSVARPRVTVMFGEMLDTSPAARERYDALLRGLTPAQRAKLVSAATKRMRRMVEAGERMKHPAATDAEISRLVAERLYGDEVPWRRSGRSSATTR